MVVSPGDHRFVTHRCSDRNWWRISRSSVYLHLILVVLFITKAE